MGMKMVDARKKDFHMSCTRARTRSMWVHVCVRSLTDDSWQNVDVYQSLRRSSVTSLLPRSGAGNDFVGRIYQKRRNDEE